MTQFWKSINENTKKIFNNYLLELVHKDPSIVEATRHFADIECPTGSLKTNIAFLLHWPPLEPGLLDYGSIGTNQINRSLKDLRSIFVDFDDYFSFDLIPRRYSYYDAEGKKRHAENIYRLDSTYPIHLKLAKSLLNSLEATSENPLLIVIGSPASKFLDVNFTVSAEKLELNGRVVSFPPRIP